MFGGALEKLKGECAGARKRRIIGKRHQGKVKGKQALNPHPFHRHQCLPDRITKIFEGSTKRAVRNVELGRDNEEKSEVQV